MYFKLNFYYSTILLKLHNINIYFIFLKKIKLF